MQTLPPLQVSGASLVDAAGTPVRLRGVGLGGWLNMENFITGYASTEQDHRARIGDVLGERLAAEFFERFLAAFFDRADAAFLRQLGMNAVRIPVNYRHLQDDASPSVISDDGFRHLDRAVELCAAEGLYTIIDLHALPGYQNQAWHSDNPTHRAGFWSDRSHQVRVIELWRAIARRYRGVSSVAGYNPVNEPGDVSTKRLVPFYAELAAAVREVDPEHTLFLEGNRYALDFDLFDEPLPNTVYALHDYALPGYPDGGPYPGISRGEYVDRKALEQKFLDRTRYQRETQTPIWVGEFGPVYPAGTDGHADRLAVLRDQLELYDRYGASWSLWTYKDVGLQGLVTVAPDSPWMQRVGRVIDKKLRLGADSWASTDAAIRDVMTPIEELMEREFPTYDPFPFGRTWMIKRLVRHILIAEPLESEFAECFRGLANDDIAPLMASFEFERCVPRGPLLDLLRSNLLGGPNLEAGSELAGR